MAKRKSGESWPNRRIDSSIAKSEDHTGFGVTNTSLSSETTAPPWSIVSSTLRSEEHWSRGSLSHEISIESLPIGRRFSAECSLRQPPIDYLDNFVSNSRKFWNFWLKLLPIGSIPVDPPPIEQSESILPPTLLVAARLVLFIKACTRAWICRWL